MITRRLLLLIALTLSGCAAFDAPPGFIYGLGGNTVCAGPNVTPGRCEALDRIGRTLYTPEMTARICAAGADTPECRK